MKPSTSEWVSKAEGDFKTAEREMAVDKSPNYNADSEDASRAMKKAYKVRMTVRISLNLDS